MNGAHTYISEHVRGAKNPPLEAGAIILLIGDKKLRVVAEFISLCMRARVGLFGRHINASLIATLSRPVKRWSGVMKEFRYGSSMAGTTGAPCDVVGICARALLNMLEIL